MTVFIFIFCITLIYSAFIFWCLNGWNKNTEILEKPNIKTLSVDVVVAIRNEERTILQLLQTLLAQTYKKANYKIVIIDDHSTDKSSTVVMKFINDHPEFNLQLIVAEGHGKKLAIAQAIRLSTAEIILTTDGDCTVSENWIRSMVAPFVKNEISFVAGPVLLAGKTSVISLLQQMEMIGLTGIAGASISNKKAMICNGANLCFRRSAYEKVQGYAGSSFASGDDTQLMRKFHSENPDQLAFVKSKSALVVSESETKLNSFWQQRRRWATKIPFTLSFFTVFIAIISWLTHAGLLVGLVLCFFNTDFLKIK